MEVLYDSGKMSTLNYYFRCFGNFGHLPKYYPPSFTVNYFTKIFYCMVFVTVIPCMHDNGQPAVGLSSFKASRNVFLRVKK